MALERIFSGLNISATGMSLQRTRMNTIAQNIANAETTRTDQGGPYRRKFVVSREAEPTVFPKYVENDIRLRQTSAKHYEDEPIRDETPVPSGTEVVEIVEDLAPPRLVYDPSHPDANEQGYVAKPNINTVTEMVDMISAARAYEANLTALNAAKDMNRKALEI
ncbi:MAG: flagellar basal body rod protein FlgC [Candidatus Glassbacteria bacterium]|nr:flagellar basal body rod protein FlgC [Candidatus Glassbacteria bacterium]